MKAQRTASKEAGVKLQKQRETAVKKMAKSESAVKAKAKERKKKDKEFTTKERARKAKLAAKQRKESASKKENLKKEQVCVRMVVDPHASHTFMVTPLFAGQEDTTGEETEGCRCSGGARQSSEEEGNCVQGREAASGARTRREESQEGQSSG